jgi:hypothetical protein
MNGKRGAKPANPRQRCEKDAVAEATAHLLEDIADIKNHSLPAITFCCHRPILLLISSSSKGLLRFYWNGN